MQFRLPQSSGNCFRFKTSIILTFSEPEVVKSPLLDTALFKVSAIPLTINSKCPFTWSTPPLMFKVSSLYSEHPSPQGHQTTHRLVVECVMRSPGGLVGIKRPALFGAVQTSLRFRTGCFASLCVGALLVSQLSSGC